MRPQVHQRFKRFSKRKKKTMWRPFHKTDRRSFTPKINKTGVNRAIKISDHRTITEITKVNHNGGTTTLATTQTAIK